jgi:hypothetical protein
VAAHSLYEQADPISFTEPDGTLKVDAARYTALDERRTHVTGATWQPATRTTIKVEGSALVGHRAVLLAGTADPRFIEQLRSILATVEQTTDALQLFLKDIGRVPLLTAAQEIHLGALIRRWQDWPDGPALAPPQVERAGRRARDKIMRANTRLVVNVAKKHCCKAFNEDRLMERIQSGMIGLTRAARNLTPAWATGSRPTPTGGLAKASAGSLNTTAWFAYPSA